jgi:agmatine deiminase
MRDIAPTFAMRNKEVVAIDWNFNGWGSTRERPARPGDQLAKLAEEIFGVPRFSVPFVADGGALITDGRGTLITSRSCVLNPNRNPICATQNELEREFATLGFTRVIWLEGDPQEPITSGHVDGYVLFKEPGSVLAEVFDDKQIEAPIWRSADIETLERVQDAAGRMLAVERIRAPRKRYWRFQNEMFAPCYLNAYLANGVVITGRFGDVERDEEAKVAFANAFCGRDVFMLKIDHISAGGGGVHCLTQPMPTSAGGSK